DVDGELGLDDLPDGDALRRLSGAGGGSAGEYPLAGPPDALVGRPLAEVERYYIEKTLERTAGNREEAAKLLGIGERTLYRVIRDWKVQDQIKEALDSASGNLAEAAKTLGMSAATLQRKIKKLGLPATEG